MLGWRSSLGACTCLPAMRWTFFARSSFLLAIAGGHLQSQIVIGAGTAAAGRVDADRLASGRRLDQLHVEWHHRLEDQVAILLARRILDHLIHASAAVDHR